MKRKIVFATKNKGKMKEIKDIFDGSSWQVVSMEEIGIDIDIEETGVTFIENALIKAQAIEGLCGEIVLADDSGLEIDYLGKAPGVESARFLGYDTDYAYKNAYILNMMVDVPPISRTARFVCAIAASIPNNPPQTCQATIEGRIGDKIAGENGFGYDPIFYLEDYGMTTAELPIQIKNQISHRGKALRMMKQILEELVLDEKNSSN